MPPIKFAASQAKCIYLYKNVRTNAQRCRANIYFNRQNLKQGVIPMYVQIKAPYTSPASKTTQKKMQISRIREEIKYLHKKKVCLCKYFV